MAGLMLGSAVSYSTYSLTSQAHSTHTLKLNNTLTLHSYMPGHWVPLSYVHCFVNVVVNVIIKNISRDCPCWKHQLRPEFAYWSSLVYARKVCCLSKWRIPVWDTSILEFHCGDQHPKHNICWWAATYADLFIRDVGSYKMCWDIH